MRSKIASKMTPEEVEANLDPIHYSWYVEGKHLVYLINPEWLDYKIKPFWKRVRIVLSTKKEHYRPDKRIVLLLDECPAETGEVAEFEVTPAPNSEHFAEFKQRLDSKSFQEYLIRGENR